MKVFYAHPWSMPDVTQAIHGAKRILSATRRDLELHLWGERPLEGHLLALHPTVKPAIGR